MLLIGRDSPSLLNRESFEMKGKYTHQVLLRTDSNGLFSTISDKNIRTTENSQEYIYRLDIYIASGCSCRVHAVNLKVPTQIFYSLLNNEYLMK